MRLILTAFLCFLFFFTAGAHAATPFGLAMHGAPKYTPGDISFSYANPDAPKGGTLVLEAIGSFDTLNPYTLKGKAAQGLNLTYDRLMARAWDEPFTMYPLIAERVDVPDDRSALTVHIDPRARFHDGAPITADDVVFSFETLRDHGRPNMRQIYKLVKAVEKRDNLTVHFTLGPGYDRETIMILTMMPVLSRQYWSGKNFDSTTFEPPLLNGPYRIAQVEPGRRIVYERVPDYWARDLLANKGHYNFDRIVYDYYRDDGVALEAFKAGSTLLRREQDGGKWEAAYDFPAAHDRRVKREALPHSRPERVRAFIFNTRRAPFDDIRVRKALGLLFDFEWVNRSLFHDRYKRIASYFPNSELAAAGMPSPEELEVLNPWKDRLDPSVFGAAWSPPANATPDMRRANMRLADRLLREAGWIVENGRRVKNGQALSFEILLGAPEDEKIALHFKRALEAMGITPKIRVLDAASYTGRLSAYDFDMTLYFWLSSLSPGTEQPLYWGCEAAEQHGRWNYAGICDPAVDAISKSIAASGSRESLVARVHALDRILTRGEYMIPLYYAGEDYAAYWSPISRPEETPLYGMVLETWWMGDKKKTAPP